MADVLCNEETAVLCFDDADSVEPSNRQSHQGNDGSELEPSSLLPCVTKECLDWMIERESQHLPRHDYLIRFKNGELDFRIRCEAIDWMIKACSCHNFGELCLYSAISFLDRYLSEYDVDGGKPWAMQLTAVTCLLIAAKINEVNVPSMVDLQVGDPEFVFEGNAVKRMEVLVLNCLMWNVKAYTPFAFVDYFLRKAMSSSVQIPQGVLIERAIQTISSTIKGIDFLEFRPSEIAAAVAVYAIEEIQAAVDIDEVVLCNLNKDRVVRCLELLQDFVSTEGAFAGPVPRSPNGVLDVAFWIDKTSMGLSCPTTSPVTKRRKLDHTAAFRGDS